VITVILLVGVVTTLLESYLMTGLPVSLRRTVKLAGTGSPSVRDAVTRRFESAGVPLFEACDALAGGT
jgi:hypothetical protein